jgi:uncharacterized protein
MVTTLPDSVDAWRMASSRRSFSGRLPVRELGRLAATLADTSGEVGYELDFGCDDQQVCYVDVRADAALQVTCQRSLQPFELPLAVDTRLGMMRHEREEAGLPPNYEPLLVPSDGLVSPVDLIEDELLLAMPLVPINPDSSLEPVVDDVPADDRAQESPFAALRVLRKSNRP